MRAVTFLLIFISVVFDNCFAQPISESITLEILVGGEAIPLDKPIQTKQNLFSKSFKYPETISLQKYKVIDRYDHKFRRGFSPVLNCGSCFKKDFPIPGHDYEMISIINTESQKTMNILVRIGNSRFQDAYLGITFKPGNFVFVFDEDYDWWKLNSMEKEDKERFKFKDNLLFGLDITPIDWGNHAVDIIDKDSLYAQDRFKVYRFPTDTIEENKLEGLYWENFKWNETDFRLAYMKIGKTIELAIKTKTQDWNTYQTITGSSLEQIEDSLFVFRGDSSWQFTSMDIQKRMRNNNELPSPMDNEPMDDHSKREMDSCANFNPFAYKNLLCAKILVAPSDPYAFKPLCRQLFDTFEISSIDSSEISTYQFADIEQLWWCENLPIPVPDIESIYMKLAVIDPITNRPIKLILNKDWEHTLDYGLADSRSRGKNRVAFYIKVLSNGRLQVSDQYNSIISILDN